MLIIIQAYNLFQINKNVVQINFKKYFHGIKTQLIKINIVKWLLVIESIQLTLWNLSQMNYKKYRNESITNLSGSQYKTVNWYLDTNRLDIYKIRLIILYIWSIHFQFKHSKQCIIYKFYASQLIGLIS